MTDSAIARDAVAQKRLVLHKDSAAAARNQPEDTWRNLRLRPVPAENSQLGLYLWSPAVQHIVSAVYFATSAWLNLPALTKKGLTRALTGEDQVLSLVTAKRHPTPGKLDAHPGSQLVHIGRRADNRMCVLLNDEADMAFKVVEYL